MQEMHLYALYADRVLKKKFYTEVRTYIRLCERLALNFRFGKQIIIIVQAFLRFYMYFVCIYPDIAYIDIACRFFFVNTIQILCMVDVGVLKVENLLCNRLSLHHKSFLSTNICVTFWESGYTIYSMYLCIIQR